MTATDTVGQVRQVDPKTLLVGANVRKEVDLNPEFVGTIREVGVRIPIVAYQGPDGLVVVDGQRRTLAAIDTGRDLVPVFLTEAPNDGGRIVDQVIANEQRDPLTERDAAAAVHELALFDYTVPAIATTLGFQLDFVEKAAAVGKSKAAQKVMVKQPNLDIDDLALLAEFDEFPDEQAKIMKIAEQGGYWAGTARALREERQLKAITQQITDDPGLILIKDPGWNSSDPLPLNELYLDSKKTQRLSDADHEKLVAVAGDGLCAWPGTGWNGGQHGVIIKYAVKGWKARGLFAHESSSRPAQATTPAEAEALKAERRVARETTKAWDAESVLRIQFLQELVARKTMPKGWEPLVAARMLHNAGSFSTTQLRMVITILGLEETKGLYSIRDVITTYLKANPLRSPQIMLAIELGCIEGGGEFEKKGWQGAYPLSLPETKAYLGRLASWGHTLGDVEKSVGAAKGKKAA